VVADRAAAGRPALGTRTREDPVAADALAPLDIFELDPIDAEVYELELLDGFCCDGGDCGRRIGTCGEKPRAERDPEEGRSAARLIALLVEEESDVYGVYIDEFASDTWFCEAFARAFVSSALSGEVGAAWEARPLEGALR
jgi:hypothetical protein